MEKNGIVAYREKLEQVIGRYHDFLGDEAERLCREHSIPSAKGLQGGLTSIVDEDRLLKIGIVGRVKSGKSSLLNALLFRGRSILPKAATPMTAALTTLSYGETPSAEVEFFTQEDFEDIKDKHAEYNLQWNRLYRETLEQEKQRETRSRKSPEARAESKVNREMRNKVELSAAHDQYTKMQDTGLSIRELGESKLLGFEKLSDLSSQLDDYVGANGKYMPFTKSVNIRLPQENLKDIEIVDTPGINDPVQSREERTRQHLNQCDVVLIVSPAGQCINEVDLKLMDRITSKEGIRKLFVVAAKADDELFGHLREENEGQLDRVLDSLTEELGTSLREVIENLKEINPEVGDTYDQLLQEQSQIILSSGICESLKQLFDQRNEWDKDMQHAWDSLLDDYPDHFSNTDGDLSRINLDKLSNISAIQNIVEKVRAKKQEIIKRRKMEYIQTKRQSLHALKDGLLAYANERQALIESTDIEKIKKQHEKLEKALNDASWDIKLDYEESVTNITSSLEQALRRELKRMEGETQSEYQEARDTTRTIIEKEGFLNKVARKLWGGGYRQETYTTIHTHAVVRSLSKFSMDLVNLLIMMAEEKKTEWRNVLIKDMINILRENFDDASLEASMIRRVIRIEVNSISLPEFQDKNQMPDSLKPQSVLEGDEAERFIRDAENYLYRLWREFYEYIEMYTRDLAERMKTVRLSDQLLERSQKELAMLGKSIENKEMELKRISNLRGELEKIEVNQ